MNDDDSSDEGKYDAVADGWETFTESPWKRRVLWPTIRSLLPALADKRVLDVGCGDGTYSARLADRDADVVGIDLSREMIEVAREKHGDCVEFRRADTTETLEFADEEGFDVVLCQHVLSHVPDLDGPFAEFARVLEPGGTVVVSTHNPVHDFLVVREREYPDTSGIDGVDMDPTVALESETPTYHDTEPFEIRWDGSARSDQMKYYRRPVSELLQPVLDAGFELQELVEPDLRERFETDPAVSQDVLRRPPRSICFSATRSPDQ